ncbi:MAG: class I SAM-dependent methyltransferase [Anaerolineales bacterium]|jgi:hypothetical protein
MTSWELQRNWDIVRYIVYYLIEDLVPPDLIPGRDIIDFSAGLADLSEYIYAHKPGSLTATSPDSELPDSFLHDRPGFRFLTGFQASQIDERLDANSVDLFIARMVFQFPTDEKDRIDVDGMLSQIHTVLRPGGRLIMCSHEFVQLDEHPDDRGLPFDQYLQKIPSHHTGRSAQRIRGLVELIQSIGIPPREGVHGQTGFGLKGLMAVDSFVKCGYQIENAAEIEDFTFPIGISRDLTERRSYYQNLAEQVFQIKKTHINTPAFGDKYRRPTILRNILMEISKLHRFVTVPIFKIQARKV